MKKYLLILTVLLSACSTTDYPIYNGQNTVYFDSNSTSLSPMAKHTLNKEIAFYKQTDDNLVIVGYTDNSGNSGYNLQLGFDRAVSVKQYFISKGFAEERLTVVSYGESEKPYNKNDYTRCVQILVEDFD